MTDDELTMAIDAAYLRHRLQDPRITEEDELARCGEWSLLSIADLKRRCRDLPAPTVELRWGQA